MITDQIFGIYSASRMEYFGLSYTDNQLAALVIVEVTVSMICAGISLTPRLSADISIEPRLTGAPNLVEC